MTGYGGRRKTWFEDMERNERGVKVIIKDGTSEVKPRVSTCRRESRAKKEKSGRPEEEKEIQQSVLLGGRWCLRE